MADIRGGQAVVGVDATTRTQGWSISASGLKVDLGADNDVTITGAVDTELPAAAALADNAANPTAPAVGAFAMVFDGANWDRLAGNSVDGALVNLGANNDVTVTGAVDTELPAAVALADATANPTVPGVGGFLMGFDGVDWNRVAVDGAGQLQVDVLSGGGEPLPTGPTVDTALATVAVGASAFLDSAEITEAEKIWGASIASTVLFKFRFGFQENGVRTPKTGWMFGQAATVVNWRPSHRDFYVHVGASAGVDTIYAEVFNLDPSQTADIHATFEYATG